MIYTVCLAFTRTEVVSKTIERYKETFGKTPHEFVIVDNHYPVHKKETSEALLSFGNVIRPYKNLGLHNGANFAIEQCKMQENDVYIGIDHDAWPDKEGWGDALVDVMKDPSIASCSLWNDHVAIAPGRIWTESTINGHRILEDPNNFGVNGLTAYSVGAVKAAGGFQEPCAYYGHIEQWMWQHWKAMCKRHVYLADFKDDLTRHAGHDPLYTAYKIEHAHKMSFQGSFEEWLEAGGHT